MVNNKFPSKGPVNEFGSLEDTCDVSSQKEVCFKTNPRFHDEAISLLMTLIWKMTSSNTLENDVLSVNTVQLNSTASTSL